MAKIPKLRIGRRKVPRFWYQIWDLTRARIPGCSALPSPRMVALKGDLIWTAISDFGLPFPPFKFGSGMGVENVSWDECLDLVITYLTHMPSLIE